MKDNMPTFIDKNINLFLRQCRSAVSTYEFPRIQRAVRSTSDKKRHQPNDVPGPRMKRSKSSSLNFPLHFERPTKIFMPVANV